VKVEALRGSEEQGVRGWRLEAEVKVEAKTKI
jgi:hypothetical protein